MKIKNIGFKVLITIIFLVNFSFAQFEDEEMLFGEEEIAEVICVPETLASNYDNFKDEGFSSMEIRQFYSFGSEYFKNKAYTSALPYLWKVFLTPWVLPSCLITWKPHSRSHLLTAILWKPILSPLMPSVTLF